MNFLKNVWRNDVNRGWLLVIGAFFLMILFVIWIVSTVIDLTDHSEIDIANYNAVISMSVMCPNSKKIALDAVKDNKFELYEYRNFLKACDKERKINAMDKLRNSL